MPGTPLSGSDLYNAILEYLDGIVDKDNKGNKGQLWNIAFGENPESIALSTLLLCKSELRMKNKGNPQFTPLTTAEENLLASIEPNSRTFDDQFLLAHQVHAKRRSEYASGRRVRNIDDKCTRTSRGRSSSADMNYSTMDESSSNKQVKYLGIIESNAPFGHTSLTQADQIKSIVASHKPFGHNSLTQKDRYELAGNMSFIMGKRS